MMEADERPTKIRKLDSAQGDQAPEQPFHTELSAQETAVARNDITTSETHKLSNGDDKANAANNSKPELVGVDAGGELLRLGPNPLSKNQQKKAKRRQQWEAKEPERKAKRKEQRRQKKVRDRARRAGEDEATKSQRYSRRQGQLLPITVVFDCGFDDLMHEKEIVSLASQLTRCYSENRNARFKSHLAVSSFGGRLKERFDNVLKKSYESWDGFGFYDNDFVSVSQDAASRMSSASEGPFGGAFTRYTSAEASDNGPPGDLAAPGEVIYLSSDSDVTLTELKPFSTYIIGGLVDRNRYKGKCYKAALGKGVKTARLPIGEYLEMSSRHILTTNHVLEIMLKWLELDDWGAAFTDVIPKRKGGVLKAESGGKIAQEDDCVIEESGEGSDGDDADEQEGEDAAVTLDAERQDERQDELESTSA